MTITQTFYILIASKQSTLRLSLRFILW